MKKKRFTGTATFICLCSMLLVSNAQANNLPEQINQIMNQPRYSHAHWALVVKDLNSDKILYELNSNQLILPASVTKIFTMTAVLDSFGGDFQFKTSVETQGKQLGSVLEGDLVIKGQGDFIFGGRHIDNQKVDFKIIDHTYSNYVPGAELTPQDPLFALRNLARQLKDKGIKKIKGNIIINDDLFETVPKRDMMLSPLFINENVVDFTFKPTKVDQLSELTSRPNIGFYTIENKVKTVAKDKPSQIDVITDGQKITLQGQISLSDLQVIRNQCFENPKAFARQAFMTVLKEEGITLENVKTKETVTDKAHLKTLATFVSPPLSEYVKLVLKISHNLGADMAPLLLASRNGLHTFDEGMPLIGSFLTKTVGIPSDEFVFFDAAGADSNRITPKAAIKLLDYFNRKPEKEFNFFYHALPILGIDGSLALGNFGQNSQAKGKIHAKPGTGIVSDFANESLFLTTQSLAGYIDAKNGHRLAFIIAVNNAHLKDMNDALTPQEDISRIASIIYELVD